MHMILLKSQYYKAIAKNYDQLVTWRKEKNGVVPEEPGKMGYIQPWVKEVSEWVMEYGSRKASPDVLKSRYM
jgi:hypothetical protein